MTLHAQASTVSHYFQSACRKSKQDTSRAPRGPGPRLRPGGAADVDKTAPAPAAVPELTPFQVEGQASGKANRASDSIHLFWLSSK